MTAPTLVATAAANVGSNLTVGFSLRPGQSNVLLYLFVGVDGATPSQVASVQSTPSLDWHVRGRSVLGTGRAELWYAYYTGPAASTISTTVRIADKNGPEAIAVICRAFADVSESAPFAMDAPQFVPTSGVPGGTPTTINVDFDDFYPESTLIGNLLVDRGGNVTPQLFEELDKAQYFGNLYSWAAADPSGNRISLFAQTLTASTLFFKDTVSETFTPALACNAIGIVDALSAPLPPQAYVTEWQFAIDTAAGTTVTVGQTRAAGHSVFVQAVSQLGGNAVTTVFDDFGNPYTRLATTDGGGLHCELWASENYPYAMAAGKKIHVRWQNSSYVVVQAVWVLPAGSAPVERRIVAEKILGKLSASIALATLTTEDSILLLTADTSPGATFSPSAIATFQLVIGTPEAYGAVWYPAAVEKETVTYTVGTPVSGSPAIHIFALVIRKPPIVGSSTSFSDYDPPLASRG